MSSIESRKEIYKRARAATGMDKHQWARLFSLGENKGVAEVNKKERGVDWSNQRGVNMPEALAAGLIEFFMAEGYAMDQIEFDENGEITNIPKSQQDK